MFVPAVLLAAAAPPAVERWAPSGVSSPMFESHPAFDPRTGDLYFVRSSPKFEGWRIKLSRCGANGWEAAVDAPFAGDGVEADPWFTPDGKGLYFISSRSSDGGARKDLDIWKVDRDTAGRWGTPQRLPAPVNSAGQEWFPRLGRDGWLYFGSNRPGGLGKTDVWRARQGARGWTVENLGPTVNTPENEYEALPSPDGKRLIVETAAGYFESRADGRGWSARVKLGAEINVNGSEIGAAISPSGRTLIFARDIGEGMSGELLVWRMRGAEAWPPTCPR